MSRFRVAASGVGGRFAYDLYTRETAIRAAKAEQKAGARDVVVLEERPWPESERRPHFVANFVQVWP